uniref:Uncharacterized protein n=1 Tax=Romanomermis culicivorax TaxID=13658 RepID=A0A915I1F4_ROMCU
MNFDNNPNFETIGISQWIQAGRNQEAECWASDAYKVRVPSIGDKSADRGSNNFLTPNLINKFFKSIFDFNLNFGTQPSGSIHRSGPQKIAADFTFGRLIHVPINTIVVISDFVSPPPFHSGNSVLRNCYVLRHSFTMEKLCHGPLLIEKRIIYNKNKD